MPSPSLSKLRARPRTQVSLVPYVSENVARRAALALRAMDRYPLADNALMGVGETEDEEAEGEEVEAQVE